MFKQEHEAWNPAAVAYAASENQTAETASLNYLPTNKEYIDALLLQLQAETLKHRKQKAKTRRLRYLILGIIILYFAFMLYTGLATGHWDFPVNFGIFGGLSAFGSVALTNQHKAAAKELAQFDDIRAVGPLAETLDADDKEMRAVVLMPLTRLLPRLKASDFALLDAVQRENLNRELLREGDKAVPELILAILKAYEQVGDIRALPAVQKLANGEIPGIAPRIREAAQRCEEFLNERIKQQQAAQTLLRASSAIGTSPDQLLRPASGVTETDPNQLLRPNNSPPPT